MLIHLLETGRPRPWHPGSTFWSTSAHAALVASAVAASLPADERPRERVEREVVYLLPTLPSSPRRPSEPDLRYVGGDDGAKPRDGQGLVPVQRGHRTQKPATDRVPSPIIPVVFDSLERAGSPVFVAADLDRVVERDPTSAAPSYPPDLEKQAVEGGVSAEWVVDSTGHADTTSFHVVTSTHPGFTEAVRAVLPLMRFRPAELAGRRVAQMVRQEFMFRIHLPEPEPPRVPQRP